jgi:toxin CcdB
MARFDVRPRRGTTDLLVECQSDFLSELETRFVVPLLPRSTTGRPIARLNPVFVIENRAYVLFPQFALSMLRTDLGRAVASLAHEQDRVIDAIDYLLSGI